MIYDGRLWLRRALDVELNAGGNLDEEHRQRASRSACRVAPNQKRRTHARRSLVRKHEKGLVTMRQGPRVAGQPEQQEQGTGLPLLCG